MNYASLTIEYIVCNSNMHHLSEWDFQCNLGLSDSKRSCAAPVKLGSVDGGGGGGGPHGSGSHSLADGPRGQPPRAPGPAAVGYVLRVGS